MHHLYVVMHIILFTDELCFVRLLLDCIFISFSFCVSAFVRFFFVFGFVFCFFYICFCLNTFFCLLLFKYMYLFLFALIFRGTCCFGFGIKFFVTLFVVHNRMHKYPIELIVSILLHETDWCYIGRHPRNSSDD